MESNGASLAINDKASKYPPLKPKRVMVKSESIWEEQVFYPLVYDMIPEEFQRMAKQELNETEHNRAQGLKRLKEIMKQERLPYCTDDEFLLTFLRSKKFNIKKAEDKMRQFSLPNKSLIDFIATLDVEKVRAILDNRCASLLPYRDRMGRTVIYTRGCGWIPELFSLEETTNCLIALAIFASTIPMSSVCGVCYIPDSKVNSAYDAYHILLNTKNKLPVLVALPFLFKRIDSINESFIVRCFFKAIRPLLPSKQFRRIFMHGKDMESLYKIYHPSILPPEFGGNLENWEDESWKETFLEFLQKLKCDFEHYRKGNIATSS